jgi:hypothetical protein
MCEVHERDGMIHTWLTLIVQTLRPRILVHSVTRAVHALPDGADVLVGAADTVGVAPEHTYTRFTFKVGQHKNDKAIYGHIGTHALSHPTAVAALAIHPFAHSGASSCACAWPARPVRTRRSGHKVSRIRMLVYSWFGNDRSSVVKVVKRKRARSNSARSCFVEV